MTDKLASLAMTPNSALLIMWITFSVVALAGVIAVFVWAIRSRQFANQDRARYLALQSGIPADDAAKNDARQDQKE